MKTRKQYEDYLNESLAGEPHPFGHDKPLAKPGTWLRRNDPIQFGVGFNEYQAEKGRQP